MSVRTVKPQYMHTRESRDHTVTKLKTFVQVVYETKLCVQNFVANGPRLTKLQQKKTSKNDIRFSHNICTHEKLKIVQ